MSSERTVLILSYNFPPRGGRKALRTEHVVRELPALGWKTIVLTCAPDGTQNRDEGWSSLLMDTGIDIYKTKPIKLVPLKSDGSIKIPSMISQKVSAYLQGFAHQPDRYMAWQKQALELANQIINEHFVNVIYASAPPFSNIIIAQELANKHNIPFVVDYGDTWIECAEHTYPTPMHRTRNEAMQEHVLKQAAFVFASSRTMKEHILRKHRFLSHEEISIIPHGFLQADYEAINAQPNALNGCVITHYADFINGETPKYFLQALRALHAKNKDVAEKITLRIVGLVRPSHKKLIRKYGLTEKVHVVSPVERNAALQYVMESDALWLCTNNDTTEGIVALNDLLGSRKPLLVTSSKQHILEAAKPYNHIRAVEYKNVEAIQKELEKIVEEWKRNNLQKASEQTIEQAELTPHIKEVSRRLGMSMRL